MKSCSNCNKTFNDEVNFCNICGEKLQIDTTNLQKQSKKMVLAEKVKQNPLDIQLVFEYASYLFEIRNFKESLEEAFKLISIDESHLFSKTLIIKCLIEIGDIKKAIELAKNYLEIHPVSSELRLLFAELQILDNDPDTAIKLVDNIIDEEPGNIAAKRLKALIYSEHGNYNSVLHLWNDVYNTNNNDQYALLFVAIASFNHDKNNKTSPPIFARLLSSIETGSFFRLILLTHSLITHIQGKEYEAGTNILEELKSYDKIDTLPKDLTELFIINIYDLSNQLLTSKKEGAVLDIVNLFEKWNLIAQANEIKALIYFYKAQSSYEAKEFNYSIDNIKQSIKLVDKNSIYYQNIYDLHSKIKTGRAESRKRIFKYSVISVVALILIVFIVNIFGFISERMNWKEAQNINSTESYQSYIERYPKGRFINPAKEKYENLFWENTLASNTSSDFSIYINEFPTGIYLSEAKKLKEERFFSEAEKSGNDKQLIDYIKTYPNGVYLELAINNLKENFYDSRDKQIYRTVTIGNQTWFAENLNYRASGSNSGNYGRFYNWNTAQNVCPPEWRLPSDSDWSRLVSFVGDNPGRKLKTKTGWESNGNGNDVFDFSATPGGYYSSVGVLFYKGAHGTWWSSTESSSSHAWERTMSFNSNEVKRRTTNKAAGYKVRCIKNN